MANWNGISKGLAVAGLLPTLQLSLMTVFSAGSPGSSLKEKSDEELLALVMGPTKPSERNAELCGEDRVKPSPLDRLWEMPARDAALEFVKQYVSEESSDATFKFDNPTAKPPVNGEIGFRWISGNEYAPPEHGVTILKNDGYQSRLLMSQVQILGKASEEEIDAAVMKTDMHPIPRLVARQTYEIIWWLRHVRVDHYPAVGGTGVVSTADDLGDFWMKPDGPDIKKTLFSEPCGHCISFDQPSWYPGFAYKLVARVIERSGIKRRYPMPRIGEHVDPDEDAKFLHTLPPERDDNKALKHWIGRLTEILRNPERQYLHEQIMDVLVPIADPLRYDDQRINDALLDVLHKGLEAQPKLKRLEESAETESVDPDELSDDPDKAAKALHAEEERRKQRRGEARRLNELHSNGLEAAEKLGVHDGVAAFPELFELAKHNADELPGFNRPLIAAASIAARHTECRAQLIEYLKEKLSDPAEQTSRGSPLLEAVWRADLRDLTPELEKIAHLPSPPPNPKDVRPSAIHKASVILMAWHENDALTKTKLDALLTGYVGGASYVPEVLRKEFAALSGQDQLKLREFVTWMRTVDVGWSRRYLENAFTPHTPRPDIPLER